MTFLISLFAAIITTVIWYNGKHPEMKLGLLCYMFWGASLMWFIDCCFEYAELHDAFFTPAIEDMINDAYLGFSVVALALVVWVVYVLIKDPKGTVRKALKK